MSSSFRFVPLSIIFCLSLGSAALAQEDGLEVAMPAEDRQVSFGEDVLPILRKNCLACHNKSETEGELIMESIESLMEGGDSGPAIVPGNADESTLFQLAAHQTEPIMPPVDNDVGAKPLSPTALGLLKRWIDQGAKADEEEIVDEIHWKKVPPSYAQIFAMELSPDGRWLAAGRGNELVMYSVAGKREVQRLSDPAINETHPNSAHLDVVQSLAWSPDGQTVVSGGFRCLKVWQRRAPAVADETSSDEDRKLLGDEFKSATSFVLSADKKRLVALMKSDAGVVAKLAELPSRKVLREFKSDLFSAEYLDAKQRDVGLRAERLRVAKADVDAAKKRKDDDEKNTKKNEEDLKKAEAEVPKKKEAQSKADEANKKKQGEFDAQQTKIDALKKALAALKDDEKKAKQDELKKAEEQLNQRKKELDKTKAEAKKKLQEFEGSEKVVTLAKEAIERGKKAISLRTEELAAAEKEATEYEKQHKSAQTAANDAAAKAKENATEFGSLHLLEDEWQFGIRGTDGRLACFDFTTGETIGLYPHGEDVADDGPAWELVKTIGSPSTSETFADRVTTLAFSQDGSMLASGGGEPSRTGEVQIWSTSDWSLKGELKDIHSDVVYDLQFSPQDDTLASCGSDRMMKTIDPKTAKPLRNFEGHTGHVLGVAWRADGRTLATAGADKVVKVWDAREGTQTKTVSGFKSEITAVRFLGLEDRFVFSIGDGKVESRNSGGGGKPGFGGFADYVHKVSSSLDGKVVAAAGQDQVIRVWDSAGKLKAEFKK